MRPRMTIGLDAEQHHDLYGHALVFARLPVSDMGQAGLLAVELGFGAHNRRSRAQAMYKATLSWGKGFESGRGHGWMAVNAALENRTHEALIHKLDVTIGLSSARRFDPLLEVETSYVSGHPLYWTIRPSLVYSPQTGPNSWVLGVERNSFQGSWGVKAALWRDF